MLPDGGRRIPRLYAAASLKLEKVSLPVWNPERRIPRLYAAASLKPFGIHASSSSINLYSAALCRGLIEAAYRQSAGSG